MIKHVTSIITKMRFVFQFMTINLLTKFKNTSGGLSFFVMLLIDGL